MTGRFHPIAFHAQFNVNPHNAVEMLVGLALMGEDNWQAHAAGHLAVWDAYGLAASHWRPVVIEADAPGVVCNDLVGDLEYYDGVVYAFSFNPPLTEAEDAAVEAAMSGVIGRRYNWLLLGEHITITIVRFLSYVIGNPILRLIAGLHPVDVMAGRAFICYQIVAIALNATGRPELRVDPLTFGPLDLWRFAEQGHLTADGPVTMDPPPVVEAPE